MFGFGNLKLSAEVHGLKAYVYSLEKQSESHEGLLKECCSKIDQLTAKVGRLEKEVKKPPLKKKG